MKRTVLAACLLVTVVAACGDSSTTAAPISLATPEDAAAVISEPGTVLLDIRTPEEVVTGVIPGATHIDFYAADFADRIGALDRNTTYVVYCRSGNRSAQAMDLFRSLEFSSVTEIDGGIVAWSSAGLEIE